LQQELVQKDKFFANKVEVYKAEVAQALLVGFEVAVEQASSLQPPLELGLLSTWTKQNRRGWAISRRVGD